MVIHSATAMTRKPNQARSHHRVLLITIYWYTFCSFKIHFSLLKLLRKHQVWKTSPVQRGGSGATVTRRDRTRVRAIVAMPVARDGICISQSSIVASPYVQSRAACRRGLQDFSLAIRVSISSKIDEFRTLKVALVWGLVAALWYVLALVEIIEISKVT